MRPWQAFDSEKFERWQPQLLALLNEPRLRRWARARMGLNEHQVGREDEILSISPHCFIVPAPGLNTYRATFMPQPALQKSLYRAFRPAFWAMHGYDLLLPDRCSERWVQSLIRPIRPVFEGFGLSTLTAYPQAGGGGGNTTCDGLVAQFYSGGAGQTFATICAAAGSSADPSAGGYPNLSLDADTVSSRFTGLSRIIFNFDTSVIIAGASVSSVTLSLYSAGGDNGLGGTLQCIIVSASPASKNTVVNADFSTLGGVAFGTYYASYYGQYNDIALNTAGCANIVRGGISSFGARLWQDFNNSFDGLWVSGAHNRFFWSTADTGSNAPKLVVIYSAPTPKAISVAAAGSVSILAPRILRRELTTSGTGTADVGPFRILLTLIVTAATGTVSIITGTAFNMLISVAATGTAALSKAVAKVIAESSAGSAALSRTVGRVLAFSATGSVVYSRLVSLTRAFTATGSVTLNRLRRLLKAITATATGSALLMNASVIAKTIAVAASGTASVIASKVRSLITWPRAKW
jgi:hypothetical protein